MTTKLLVNKILNYIELLTKRKIYIILDDIDTGPVYIANQPSIQDVMNEIKKEIEA